MPLSLEEKAQLDKEAFIELMAEKRQRTIAPPRPQFANDPLGTGFPMSPEKDASVLGGIASAVKPAILPTGGAVAGGMLGGGIGAPFGMAVPGMMAGEAGGSALGEMGNQMLGITAKDPNQVFMAAGAPPAARGGFSALKTGLMRLPGAGVELQSIGTQLARQAPQAIQSSGSSKELFDLLHQMSQQGMQNGMGPIFIPHKHLMQAAKELIERETRLPVEASRDPAVLKLAQEVLNSGQTPERAYDVQAFAAQRSRFGRDMKFDTTKPSGVAKANEQFYAAIDRDLEDAAKGGTTPAAQALQAASQATKLEKTRDELADYIGKKIIQPQAGTGLEYVSAKSLVQHLKNDKRILGLPKDQQQDLMATAKMLNKIPSLPPPGFAQHGSGRIAARGAGAALVAHLGGLDPQSVSMAAGAAMSVPQLISYALTTGPGRGLLRGLLKSTGGTLTPRALAVLGAFTAATQSQPGTIMTQ